MLKGELSDPRPRGARQGFVTGQVTLGGQAAKDVSDREMPVGTEWLTKCIRERCLHTWETKE